VVIGPAGRHLTDSNIKQQNIPFTLETVWWLENISFLLYGGLKTSASYCMVA
jgi:hypothetical protein